MSVHSSADTQRRVRDDVREGLAVAVTSAATAIVLAVTLTLLSGLGG